MISLEQSIAAICDAPQLPADGPHQQPGAVKTWLVCPLCKRIPTFFCTSQCWTCAEHGQVTPIKSAVYNDWPFFQTHD